MNTIVLGYKTHHNGRGTGLATLVAGPEVTGTEQANILAKAKAENKYPTGLTFLQLAYLTPRQTAIAAPAKAPVESPKKIEPKEKK